MISEKDWIRYIARLKAVSEKAASEMQAYVDRFGFDNTTAVIRQAYALATRWRRQPGQESRLQNRQQPLLMARWPRQ